MRLHKDSSVFKERTLQESETALQSELSKLIHQVPVDLPNAKDNFFHEMKNFQDLFQRYINDSDSEVNWDKIRTVPESLVKPYGDLKEPLNDSVLKSYLDKLVVVKLNGGLGTSMGCSGPKSVISVRDDLTFLDLNIQQIEQLNNKYQCDIPLVLMNSFNTAEDTEKVLRKYHKLNVRIFTFMQSMYPRLDRESLLPIARTPHMFKLNSSVPVSKARDSAGDVTISSTTAVSSAAAIKVETKTSAKSDDEGWYPPGHGDFYRSFVNSGLADQFMLEKRDWVFLSNIDNLGATVDVNILTLLCETAAAGKTTEFVMEVTDKTRADIKGGTLIDYEGQLRLLEIAQVPKDHVDDFVSVRKFRIFNTNNLWMHLPAVIRCVNEDRMHMEVIKNPKTLQDGTNIIQLEEAAGAAIKNFTGGIGINVPRSRFLPVKTTSDLLLIMSNLYEMEHGSLYMSPKRNFPSVPLIRLGSHFKKVKDFLNRFENIPDLLELDQLTVSGDVFFGKNLSLKGTVIIIANHGEFINMPTGSVLENKIVSGNLRILDH